MTVWLLVLLAVQSGQITGAALVAPFRSQDGCIAARQELHDAGRNIRHTRCVEVTLAEDA